MQHKVTGAVVALLVLSACSGGGESVVSPDASDAAAGGTASPSTESDTVSPTESATDDVVADALRVLEEQMSGVGLGSPPPSGPEAEVDKSLWLITCGSPPGCTSAIDAAAGAAEGLGWDVTRFDGELQPSVWVTGLEQAVAAQADGIITVGIDCSLAKSGYQRAADAGIPVLALATADDCTGDGGNDPLITLLPGTRQLYEDQGRLGATAAIARTAGTAKVLQFNEPDFSVTVIADQAFTDTISNCAGCEVLAVQDITAPVYSSPPEAQQIISSLIAQHPDATAIWFDNDSYLGLVASEVRKIREGNPEITILGGEGLPQALSLVREGVVDSLFAIPAAWQGWAAVDSMNRLFSGVAPDSLPDTGVGLVYVDAEHGLPEDDTAVVDPDFDFRAAYEEIWSGATSG